MDIIGGGTPKTTTEEYWNGTIPWLSVKDFNNSQRYVYTTEKSITEFGLVNSSTKLLDKDDIIISARGTVGELAMIPFPMAFNQSCYGLKAKKTVVSPVFLYYLLKYHIESLRTHTHGSVFDTITRDTFSGIEVDIPTLNYQEQIGEILSSLDDKIELNNKINDNLQQQVHALFRAWFVDFLPFDGQVPSNWRYVSFSDILTPRVEKSSDPSLQMFSVTDTGIHPRDKKFKKKLSMSGTKSKIVYQDDLVFGMSREILNWGVMRWPVGGVSSAYNVFSVCNDINTYYLEAYMRSNIHYFKDLIRPASREGQGIDKNALMHKEILMPPENVLHSYYHHEDTLTRLTYNNVDENTRLSIIRDTLLPKLMSGELDVSDIDL